MCTFSLVVLFIFHRFLYNLCVEQEQSVEWGLSFHLNLDSSCLDCPLNLLWVNSSPAPGENLGTLKILLWSLLDNINT